MSLGSNGSHETSLTLRNWKIDTDYGCIVGTTIGSRGVRNFLMLGDFLCQGVAWCARTILLIFIIWLWGEIEQ